MTTHVVSALVQKYRRLLGELSALEREIEVSRGVEAWDSAVGRYDGRKTEIDEALVHLEAAIWLFDEKWDPSTAKPIVPRAEFESGKLANAAYGVLRDSPGYFLSAKEMARFVVVRLEMDSDSRTIAKVAKIIATACDRQVKRGYFHVQDGPPKRWSVGKSKPILSSASHGIALPTTDNPFAVANTPSMLPKPRLPQQS